MDTPISKQQPPYSGKLTMALVVAGLLILAATGKIHWVGAALASLIAALRFALPMLIKSLPLIARMFVNGSGRTDHKATRRSRQLK